jgi:hypothetical protein
VKTIEIARSFRSAECPVCRDVKDINKSFCHSCYYTLPSGMRRALYKRFGEGYEEAFNMALAHLDPEKGGVSNER